MMNQRRGVLLLFGRGWLGDYNVGILPMRSCGLLNVNVGVIGLEGTLLALRHWFRKSDKRLRLKVSFDRAGFYWHS